MPQHRPWEPWTSDLDDGLKHLVSLRVALRRYQLSPSATALDRAFVAAAASVAFARGERSREPADGAELQELLRRSPEFARVVDIAAGVAGRGVDAAARALWQRLGLASAPPGWDRVERSGARLLIASALVPAAADGGERLRARLRRLAAGRWAALLVDELRQADEGVWQRGLDERYLSVRRRYAPRTPRRYGQLTDLLGSGETIEALRGRLERWLADGLDFGALSAEIEAAFVQTRNPVYVA